MMDFGCPPFRSDPVTAVAPARIWRGDDPCDLLDQVGLEQFMPVRKSLLDGAEVWITLCEPGYEAATLWQKFRDRYDDTGLWPLLINPETWNACETDPGSYYRLGRLADTAASTLLDGQVWLDSQYAAARLEPSEDWDPHFRGEEDWSDSEFARARENFHSFDWTDVLETIGGVFYQMLLVPTPYPWLVPGMLGWDGACNVDLGWREHATVLRRWQHLWGAELIGLERDMMWLRHMQPIDDKDTALSVALEAYLYCPDAVNQGHDTLDALAKALLEPLWRFWWD
ncbi:DUF4253 domain-containing protein [Nocardia goodfellowii]